MHLDIGDDLKNDITFDMKLDHKFKVIDENSSLLEKLIENSEFSVESNDCIQAWFDEKAVREKKERLQAETEQLQALFDQDVTPDHILATQTLKHLSAGAKEYKI